MLVYLEILILMFQLIIILNSNFKNVDFKFYGAFHKRSNSGQDD